MTSNCAREDLGWILGNKYYLKVWSGTGTDCPQKWWDDHPWKCSKGMWVWHLGLWFFGEYDGASLIFGISDLGGLF